MNEISELQAVDFALGAYIAGAFAGYADAGPANWREFLKRSANAQVIRHDADSPQQFVQDYLAAQKGQGESATGAAVNQAKFPIVYYFRKPGFVNTTDQKGSRGKVGIQDKVLALRQLPLSLDYTLVFLAFDKPTLDKLLLSWYAWVTYRGAFPCTYRIGGENLPVRCAVLDHNNVILSNASFTEGGNRFYTASSTYTVNSNILVGEEVTLPVQRLIYGFERETEERYVVTSGTLAYVYDTSTRAEGRIPMQPGTVSVWDGNGLVATDDGKGAIQGGTVDYYNGVVTFALPEAPAGVVSVSFAPMLGRLEVA